MMNTDGQAIAKTALPTEKRCRTCREVKPASEFWVNRSGSIVRLQSDCKECSMRRIREVQYPKMRHTAKFRAQDNARTHRYRSAHPEIVYAHSKAARHKKVLKKDKCEHCGSKGKLHMHHPDYSQPLLVVTLCNPCHEAIHHQKTTARSRT